MKSVSWVVKLMPVYILTILILVALAVGGSHATTTIAENTPIINRTCVVIDAGHGGVDGGATSCTGVLESAINLDIAIRLDDLLHLLGIKTLMIRTTDRSVYTEGNSITQKKVSDLQERVRIINNTEQATLISIHQNFFSDSRYFGAQVFYSHNEESKALAQNLQTTLNRSLCLNSKRMIKPADNIYLLDNIKPTGVLIECGFLSNPEEEAKIRDGAYQKKLCCVIASVCSQHVFRNNTA